MAEMPALAECATVARSLRSLRPHHSPIPPAQAFRPSWLRCERVKQRVITTGENGGDKLVHGSGGISQPRAE